MTDLPRRDSGPSNKTAKAYSCIRCFDRKVKCDKESPCSNCSKSGFECIFRVPPAPRRRKKRTQEEILKNRLSHYEEILRSKGIDVHKDGIRPEDLPETTPSLQETPASDGPPLGWTGMTSSGMMPQGGFVKPKLIVDQGRTRFVENNLWTSMAEEFRKPGDAMPESSDEDDEDTVVDDGIDYVLGGTPSSTGVRDLHPLPEQVATLWQIFLDNVNPLSKLIHVPTLQPTIFEASSHLDKLPRNLECLLFAIYSIAVLSLQPDECEIMLGESRTALLSRYTSGTKRALSRARFLGTSDLMVLQAFVLHLFCMRDMYDSKTLWTLVGVANRIAEGMGCHRDGTSLGLGPFETELRRRIWWQLIFLEFRTAELTGSGTTGSIGQWDTRIPSNINDIDIWPGMKEAPEPQERNTEMIFCLTRYELGQFWKQKLLTKQPTGDFTTLWSNFRKLASIDDKEKGIEELEQTLEHKFVRFCDPSVPVEFMAILVTRASTNGMRLMAHHPRRYAKDEDVPENERKVLWSIVFKLLELDNLLHTSKAMYRFKWHTDNYFQWQALIYVITELKRQPLHEQADRGWQLVKDVFENHPTFITEIKKPIHFAVGNLCLKAWTAREGTWSQRSMSMPLYTPDYIHQLRKVREDKVPLAMPKNVYLGFDQDLVIREPELPIVAATSQMAIGDVRQPFNLTLEAQVMQGQQENYSRHVQDTQSSPSMLLPQHGVRQDMQQPQPFWFDSTGGSFQNQHTDFDFNSLWQDFGSGPDAMDWTQWDLLLKDVQTS